MSEPRKTGGHRKKMSKGLKTTVITVSAVAVVAGGILGARYYFNSKKSVPVVPVEMMADTWLEDESSTYGYLTQAGTQNVYIDNALLVEEIFVQPGDQVKAGDPLLKYDMTQLRLEVEGLRIDYEMAKNNITKEKDRLAYYRTFTPYTEHEPLVKKTKKRLTTESKPTDVEKVKTKEKDESGHRIRDVYDVYNCSRNTVVTAEFLQSLLPLAPTEETEGRDAANAVLYIYETIPGYDSVLIAKWYMKGDDLDADYVMGITDDQLESLLSRYIFVGVDGSVTIGELTLPLGTIKQLSVSAIPEPAEIPYEQSMTQEEIDELIKGQEKAVQNAIMDAAQAELDYRKARMSLEDGMLRAEMDGIVASVGSVGAASSEEPLISVVSSLGYEITGTLSERQLGKIHIGDPVSITMWSNGMTYDGTINRISDYPVPQDYYGTPSADSSYQFTAAIECEDKLESWDGGQIRFGGAGGNSAQFAMSTAYVREDATGRYYVMAVGEDGRLEKRFVEVGRTLWGGYEIEIISGVSLEDYVAFPYSSDAVEGASVNYDSQEVYY